MTNEKLILDMVIKNNREIGEIRSELKSMRSERIRGYTKLSIFTGIGAMIGALVSSIVGIIK